MERLQSPTWMQGRGKFAVGLAIITVIANLLLSGAEPVQAFGLTGDPAEEAVFTFSSSDTNSITTGVEANDPIYGVCIIGVISPCNGDTWDREPGNTTAVPEPTTIVGLALAGSGFVVRKLKHRATKA
jgi:hypothetical protein